ncbi:mycothiol transferase [Cellulomonas sp. ICMP 17802]|uniref:mycothiol transferase n=1 Tax=Cellulomonas sp. ICMP 17802 TaxID=3239199 RepID=UPI00351ADDE7
MDVVELLVESYGRVEGVLERAVRGLGVDELAFRPDPRANSIAWLAWHAGRGQDAQVADVAGVAQVWTAQGWADRFGLPFDVSVTGYGQSADEVGRVRVTGDLLLGYYRAVAAQTEAYLRDLTPDDLDAVVDERWDPPVTLGVRLVSVVGDSLQHAGQASYVRGLLERAGS